MKITLGLRLLILNINEKLLVVLNSTSYVAFLTFLSTALNRKEVTRTEPQPKKDSNHQTAPNRG
jgi:hypothetical protein